MMFVNGLIIGMSALIWVAIIYAIGICFGSV